MRLHYLVVTAAALGILLIACGGDSSFSGASYPDAEALANALNDAGLECADFDREDEDGLDIHADTEGACTIDRESADLVTFKDSGAQKNWMGLFDFSCAFGSSFGTSSFPVVQGNQWAISGITATVADMIAEGFGGISSVIECD